MSSFFSQRWNEPIKRILDKSGEREKVTLETSWISRLIVFYMICFFFGRHFTDDQDGCSLECVKVFRVNLDVNLVWLLFVLSRNLNGFIGFRCRIRSKMSRLEVEWKGKEQDQVAWHSSSGPTMSGQTQIRDPSPVGKHKCLHWPFWTAQALLICTHCDWATTTPYSLPWPPGGMGTTSESPPFRCTLDNLCLKKTKREKERRKEEESKLAANRMR